MTEQNYLEIFLVVFSVASGMCIPVVIAAIIVHFIEDFLYRRNNER